jgi:O-glycosyl hydrolase
MSRKGFMPLAGFAAALVAVYVTMAGAANVTIDKNTKYQTMIGMGTHTNIKPWNERVGPFYITVDLDTVGFYDSLARDLNVIRTSRRSGANDHVKKLHARGIRHFIASSWAPPAEMKTNGESCCGGNLKTDMYDDFARVCVDFIKGFKTQVGIDLYAYSFQNEPYFYEPYNSCIFLFDEYKRMLVELGRLAQSEGVLDNTMLFGPECMGTYSRGDGVRNYCAPIIADNEAKGYLGALAVHGYKDGVAPDYGSASGWTSIWNNAATVLGVPCWLTETDMPGNNIDQALAMAGGIYVGVKFGHLSMWSKWTMANTHTNALVWDGIYKHGYYTLAHFGRYVKDGAVRLGCNSNDADVLALAFDDANRGWFSIILINMSTSSKSVAVSGAGVPASMSAFQTTTSVKGVEVGPLATASISLPPRSMTTLYAISGVGIAPDGHGLLRVKPLENRTATRAAFDLRGRMVRRSLLAPSASSSGCYILQYLPPHAPESARLQNTVK